MLSCNSGTDDDEPGDLCSEENNAYETAGCECVEDADCTCQVFTGADFLDESMTSSCDDAGRCIECFYF